MSTPAIEASRLHKSYTSRRGLLRRERVERVALRGVDLTIEPGELFGLLGPNGAGKTTIVKIFTTLLLPTTGMARILGIDVVNHAGDIRSRIGFVFGGERGLYWRLSAANGIGSTFRPPAIRLPGRACHRSPDCSPASWRSGSSTP